MSDASTRRILAAMLTENTGRHLLDSGGAYGRHWEQNQTRDFNAEPPVAYKFDVYDGRLSVEFTLNVYHYLAKRVRYDADMTATMRRWVWRHEDGSNYWHGKPKLADINVQLSDAEDWVKSLHGSGPYDGEPWTFNTYNGEDALSQTLQGVLFRLDDWEYVALQIHGGCDVRGGYTSARVFQCDSDTLFENASAVIQCGSWMPEENLLNTPPHPHYWVTDDAGYHWYFQGDGHPQLDMYDVVTENDEHHDHGSSDYFTYTAETAYLDDYIFLSEDGEAFCPLCGGKLEVK